MPRLLVDVDGWVCVFVQARCRGGLFLDSARDGDKVPISHEDQMSTLRQVFQAADRRERQRRRKPKPKPHPPDQTAVLAATHTLNAALDVADCVGKAAVADVTSLLAGCEGDREALGSAKDTQ